MSPEVFTIIIYTVLAALGILAIHSVIYRVLFVHRSLAPCDGILMRRLLDQLSGKSMTDELEWSSISISTDDRTLRRFGWLNPIRPARNGEEIMPIVDELYQEFNRHIQSLVLVSSVSTLIGLGGTVAAYYLADDVGNVLVSIAMGSTFWGVAVAIIPTVYLILTATNRDLLDDQYFRLTDSLMTPATQTIEPPVVPPPIIAVEKPEVQRHGFKEPGRRMNSSKLNSSGRLGSDIQFYGGQADE